MIYLFENIDDFTSDLLERAIHFMPLERQKKALMYKRELDKKLCVIAYLLLIYGLRKEYGINNIPEFSYLENGKPILRDFTNIHFNISHCKYGAVCVLSNKPVGVDIQDISELNMDVAKRVCNSSEYEYIFNSPCPNIEFSKLWTVKESIVKRNGIGILCDLKNLVNHDLYTETLFFEKYIVSITYSNYN